MNAREIIDTLKARRKAAGVSQQAIATDIGVHANSVVGWENRKSSPTLDAVVAWADSCDLEILFKRKRASNWRGRKRRSMMDILRVVIEELRQASDEDDDVTKDLRTAADILENCLEKINANE